MLLQNKERIFMFYFLFIIIAAHHQSYSQEPLYNTIGKTYDCTRCAQPEIIDEIMYELKPEPCKRYIDIACGSGNYTIALFDRHINIIGCDISVEMLHKARNKNHAISWYQNSVYSLPFEDNTFDGAICINAIHHFHDLLKAFKEIYRALKPGSTFIMFATMKEQCFKSWLGYYFPFIYDLAEKNLLTHPELTYLLQEAGFQHITFKPFFVPHDMKDIYLYAGKYKPEIYLDPTIRSGMSVFTLPEHELAIKQGCEKLKLDIQTGIIHDIIKRHESCLGDSMYIIATKN